MSPDQHPPARAASTFTRRGFLAGAGALGSGLALAACGAPTGSSPTTISFYLSKPEVIPYFHHLIAKYHSEQDRVRVVLDSSSNVPADFVRNRPPDLGCWNYNFAVAEFVNHGALSDLSDTPQAASINPALWPLMKQTADYPGRTSAIPYSVMAEGVIYNKELFARHGVAVPTTWSELVRVCERLTAAGVTPIYKTYADTWTIAQGLFDYVIGGMLDVAAFFGGLKQEGTNVGPTSPDVLRQGLRRAVAGWSSSPSTSTRTPPAATTATATPPSRGARRPCTCRAPGRLGQIALTSPHLSLGMFPLPVTDDPSDLKVRVNLDLALWIPEASAAEGRGAGLPAVADAAA